METCPNCGYCPHCGRSGHQVYPLAPVYPATPLYPASPWWAMTVWYDNGTATITGHEQNIGNAAVLSANEQVSFTTVGH